VSSWRQRIDPILRQEEDRSAFDIHEYGSALLQRLETLTLVAPGDDTGDVTQAAKQPAPRRKAQQQRQEEEDGSVYGFGEVVAADNPFEVCRSFAAMLQLVNNRWVAGVTGGGGVCAAHRKALPLLHAMLPELGVEWEHACAACMHSSSLQQCLCNGADHT
jgi:hypothetical protein